VSTPALVAVRTNTTTAIAIITPVENLRIATGVFPPTSSNRESYVLINVIVDNNNTNTLQESKKHSASQPKIKKKSATAL
jgi:hypothetical protein